MAFNLKAQSSDTTTRIDSNVSRNSPSLAGNPYDALIQTTNGSAERIQFVYATHRLIRNRQQREKLLSPQFPGVKIDPVLHKLINPEEYPEYKDPRNCLVFWARPNLALRDLISALQNQLLAAAPNLWLMPIENLHMTVLEIKHSVSEKKISELVEILQPKIEEITDYTFHHRARLVKPMLCYDDSAIALSFLPAAEEGIKGELETFTYHHLRRDLYGICESTGCEVASRYVLPSAHITIARFVTGYDFENNERGTPTQDTVKMNRFLCILEAINVDLENYTWQGGAVDPGGWVVGQEQGLDCQRGTLWYGYGQRVRLGKGSA